MEYERELECYERALKGYERILGKTHPSTLTTMLNIANFRIETEYCEKAEEIFQRALEGYEAQLRKDHFDTKRCAKNYLRYLKLYGNSAALEELKRSYPNIESYEP